MNLSKELLEKAKNAKNAEELMELAKAAGTEMTADEAEKAFDRLNNSGELSDEELGSVSGGCGDPNGNTGGDTPKYKVGDKVSYFNQTRGLGGLPSVKKIDAEILEVLDKKYGYFYYKVTGNLTKSENELYS